MATDDDGLETFFERWNFSGITTLVPMGEQHVSLSSRFQYALYNNMHQSGIEVTTMVEQTQSLYVHTQDGDLMMRDVLRLPRR